MQAEAVDCVVLGAGVVGLAVAVALARQGREVWVLERESSVGTGASSRNSEVIHAGLYHPPAWLKSSLCVRGRELLYAYCARHHIEHRRCGKLVVATQADQIGRLEQLQANAQACGVHDLQWLDGVQARALEPALHCVAALHSPSTGIVDSHGLMLSLQGELGALGGSLALLSPLDKARCLGAAGIRLETADGTALLARTVVNAAGLWAPDLALRFEGLAPEHVPQAWYAKGNYFALARPAPFRRLIYPVPQAAGLGVHLTLDLGGQARFGPDVQWVDSAQDLQVDAGRLDAFERDIRHYWPDLPAQALQPAYAGIRPKIQAPHERARDFCIQGPQDHGVAGLVNLFGIESPGLTACLAIGEHVAQLPGVAR